MLSAILLAEAHHREKSNRGGCAGKILNCCPDPRSRARAPFLSVSMFAHTRIANHRRVDQCRGPLLLLPGPLETGGLPSPSAVLPALGSAAIEDEALGEGGCGVELLRAAGKVKVIVAPRSGLPSAQIWPPWREMIRLTWASPMPVPSKSAARWSR